MQPLDDQLLLGAHRRAELLQHGLSRRELDGPLWLAVGSGRRAWAGTSPDNTRQRIQVTASWLPTGGAIGGWGAGWLLGARDLDGLDPTGTQEQQVLACLTPAYRLAVRPGVQISRSRLDPDDLAPVDGIACTTATRTAFDLARFAIDLTEAVVALDALGRARLLDPEHLLQYASERRRWRGRRQALAALALADRWSESCPESRLRVLWMTTAGLPTPQVNRVILDERGRPVARADLLDEEAALVVEYDGLHHADARRRSADDRRTQSLSELDLHVVRLTAVDLQRRHRLGTAGRLQALRARRLREVAGRPRSWSLKPRPPVE